jgi:hypothetical protein
MNQWEARLVYRTNVFCTKAEATGRKEKEREIEPQWWVLLKS